MFYILTGLFFFEFVLSLRPTRGHALLPYRIKLSYCGIFVVLIGSPIMMLKYVDTVMVVVLRAQ